MLKNRKGFKNLFISSFFFPSQEIVTYPVHKEQSWVGHVKKPKEEFQKPVHSILFSVSSHDFVMCLVHELAWVNTENQKSSFTKPVQFIVGPG